MTYYKYSMTVTDKTNSTYKFDGYFKDHFEAAQFLDENEREGDKVIIHSIDTVKLNSLPTC